MGSGITKEKVIICNSSDVQQLESSPTDFTGQDPRVRKVRPLALLQEVPARLNFFFLVLKRTDTHLLQLCLLSKHPEYPMQPMHT